MLGRSHIMKTLFTSTILIALFSTSAGAHCDSLDGPVVKAAEAALASGDLNLVLIWVQKDAEAEIRRAFELARETRTLGPKAKELADTYFFETLVRVHRAGEGAPFTGLKPAGRDLGPAIPAADLAVKTGDATPVVSLLTEQVRAGVAMRFERVRAARDFDAHDVNSGREYVKEYVSFIHYVEGAFDAAARPAHGHVEGERTHTPEHR